MKNERDFFRAVDRLQPPPDLAGRIRLAAARKRRLWYAGLAAAAAAVFIATSVLPPRTPDPAPDVILSLAEPAPTPLRLRPVELTVEFDGTAFHFVSPGERHD